jgi:cellulose synthase/poly-beta-1,6-N-acetylglucosamine synthase-like glycosyltransferase
VQFAFGCTMTTTKERLAEIGGWESMTITIPTISNWGTQRLGHRVEVMREAVSLVFPKESMRELFSHELRWAIGLRIGSSTRLRENDFYARTSLGGTRCHSCNRRGLDGVAVAYLTAYFVLRLCVAWIAGVWGCAIQFCGQTSASVARCHYLCGVVAGWLSDRIMWRGSEFRV